MGAFGAILCLWSTGSEQKLAPNIFVSEEKLWQKERKHDGSHKRPEQITQMLRDRRFTSLSQNERDMTQKSSEMIKRSNCISILGCFSDYFNDCKYSNRFFNFSLWVNRSHESSFDICEQSYDNCSVQWFNMTWSFHYLFQRMDRKEHIKTTWQGHSHHSQQQRQLIRETNKSRTSTLRR